MAWATGRCDCGLDLQIRQRGNAHHLAIWAETGPAHRPDCAFYRPAVDRSGRAAYVNGVIVERDGNGEVSVRLTMSLTLNTPAPDARPLPDDAPRRRGAAVQRRMTVLGLLHLLWEKAGLHYWHPALEGHRKPASAMGRVHGAASLIYAGRRDLASRLVPFAPGYGAAPTRLAEAMANSAGKPQRLVLVGFFRSVAAHRWEAGCLSVQLHRQWGLYLSIPEARWMSILKTAPREAGEIARCLEGPPVVALLVVTAEVIRAGKSTGSVKATIEDGALMRTTAHLIPIESGHEKEIADLLVLERRCFEKPLRFDAAQDLVRPDFILRDTWRSGGYPMEVFGMTSEDYLSRMEEKRAYYDRHFGAGGWWSWDATAKGAVPAFPAIAAKRRQRGPDDKMGRASEQRGS